MTATLSFLLQLFSFVLPFGRSRRHDPFALEPTPVVPFNLRDEDFDDPPNPKSRRDSSAPAGKRHGSLVLNAQRVLVNSPEARRRRRDHRGQMKNPKRVLRMARQTSYSVSRNARRTASKKIQPRQSWKAASQKRLFKAAEKVRILAQERREEEERIRREKAKFERPPARPRFSFFDL